MKRKAKRRKASKTKTITCRFCVGFTKAKERKKIFIASASPPTYYRLCPKKEDWIQIDDPACDQFELSNFFYCMVLNSFRTCVACHQLVDDRLCRRCVPGQLIREKYRPLKRYKRRLQCH